MRRAHTPHKAVYYCDMSTRQRERRQTLTERWREKVLRRERMCMRIGESVCLYEGAMEMKN